MELSCVAHLDQARNARIALGQGLASHRCRRAAGILRRPGQQQPRNAADHHRGHVAMHAPRDRALAEQPVVAPRNRKRNG